MYTHSIRKSRKSLKPYLEWGVALALVILAALVAYVAITNPSVQATTQPVAPAVVIDVEKLNAMDNSDAHDRGFRPLTDPAMLGIMGYINAHEGDAFSQAIVTEPAAKSVLDYLSAHKQLP